MSVLLLTGSINISLSNVPKTVVMNYEVRLSQYLNSVKYALENYKLIDKIVFVENTSCLYDISELCSLAKKNDKQLEILNFDGNKSKIEEKGKGYGELEIIDWSIKNSKLISTEDFFYKLTGRLIIKNFDKVVISSQKKNSFFYMPEILLGGRNYVSTIFYSVEKSIYMNYLSNLKELVNDHDGIYIEDLFYQSIIQIKKNVGTFSVFPNISGISGSSGKKYDLSFLKFMIYSIYAQLNYFNINKTTYLKMFSLLKKIKHG